MRTHPDTSADLRLRGVILLSNYVRRIVDTFRVHFSLFDIGTSCSYRAHPALMQVATLCALTLQALDGFGPCFILQPRFPAGSRVPCGLSGGSLVCRNWRSVGVSVDASLFDRAHPSGCAISERKCLCSLLCCFSVEILQRLNQFLKRQSCR